MTKNYKILLPLLPLLIFHLSSGIAQSSIQFFNYDDVAAPFIGKSLPVLETKTLRGDDFKTTDLIETNLVGGGVLLHIWSFKCSACYRELPELNLLAEQYKNRGVKIISLLVADRDTALQKITVYDSSYQLKKKVYGNDKINFEIIPVSKAQALLFIKQLTFPVDYIVDSKGAITDYSEGYYGIDMANTPIIEIQNYQFLKKKLDLITTIIQQK